MTPREMFALIDSHAVHMRDADDITEAFVLAYDGRLIELFAQIEADIAGQAHPGLDFELSEAADRMMDELVRWFNVEAPASYR